MAIDYHKTAWQCPECMIYNSVSRCKAGTAVRKCGGRGGCGTKVVVTIKEHRVERYDFEKRITCQPVRAE